jgi:hypothetical protein
LAIETETARLPPQGGFSVSAAFEFQTAPEGEEYAVPLAFEYGILDGLEVMVEPWRTRPSSRSRADPPAASATRK